MKSLVICEKPSQARAILKAIGKSHGEVLPARGLILTLKEPDDIKEDWKRWSTDLLWPGRFYDKKPNPSTKPLLQAIAQAAKHADQIIIATDCDREGQLIGDEIVDYIKFRGSVKRAIFNAEDPKSLQDAFRNLKPNSDFSGLYNAGQAREQADQISNLSLTRTATVTLRADGQKTAIGIGRVKTPVLGIICSRELEIENFEPQDLFEVDATVKVTSGHITLTCATLPKSLVKHNEEDLDDPEEEIEDESLKEEASLRGKIRRKDLAEALAKAVTGFKGPMSMVSRRAKQSPPKLFDLTALQSAASARFGWSGDHTLSIAQKLYADHTLITYPRAEAKYLPEANIKDVTQLVPALLSLSSYNGFQNLLKNPEIRKGKSGHFSDKALEGMSHYAIIPNVNTCANFVTSVRMLGADEAKLFDMIARQYMAALSPDFEYQQTTIEMIFPWKSHDWSFRTIGRIPLVPGWKEILSGSKSQDKDEVDLPVVKNGEQGLVEKAGLRTVTTRPPARYTEGSLIKVMQEVWRLVKDPDLRAKLKETRGIGTPATRAEVVKGLFKQGQIKLQGKSIVPTDGGMSLYKMLSEVSPNLLDPGRTAIWESLFEHVEKKRISAEDAVKKILSETQKEINNIVSKKGSLSISTGGGGSTRKPSAAMINAAKSIAESKSLKLPKAALSDFQTCSAFLSEHMEERKPGSEGVMLPSEKQVSYAKSLAEQTGLSLDPDILKDAKKTRDWIEKAAPKAPVRPPSEKQIAFAKSLSDSSGQPLPKNYDNDMKICSGFIEACLKSNPKKPSSGAKKNAFQPLPSLRP